MIAKDEEGGRGTRPRTCQKDHVDSRNTATCDDPHFVYFNPNSTTPNCMIDARRGASVDVSAVTPLDSCWKRQNDTFAPDTISKWSK